MKKYIIPTTECVNYCIKEAMMISGSVYVNPEDVDVMTQKQDYAQTSGWDSADWSE